MEGSVCGVTQSWRWCLLENGSARRRCSNVVILGLMIRDIERHMSIHGLR